VLLALGAPAAVLAADAALARIKAVGREGAGGARAAAAWRELSRRGPDALPEILAAMDDANPGAANWLRLAAGAIAERAAAEDRPLPLGELERFVLQTRHAAGARRMAYEWLARADPSAPDRLLPGMLRDPSPELRRDAVAAAIKEARALRGKGRKAEAVAAWRRALSGAADRDQIEEAVKELKALGVEVDVAAHFGFVRRWHLIAPFPNPDGKGFAAVYPPEKGVDLTAAYKGKGGVEARWRPYTTTDPYGMVDLNKVLGKKKGVVAYAYAVVYSPTERPVEVRLGTPNAPKVFLNGREIFGREEYHHGLDPDQHAAKGVLRAGRNELLLKLCQNEQTEGWAQAWIVEARLADAAGAAVPFTEGPAKGEAKPQEGGK
jgi:hypothetical protein